MMTKKDSDHYNVNGMIEKNPTEHVRKTIAKNVIDGYRKEIAKMQKNSFSNTSPHGYIHMTDETKKMVEEKIFSKYSPEEQETILEMSEAFKTHIDDAIKKQTEEYIMEQKIFNQSLQSRPRMDPFFIRSPPCVQFSSGMFNDEMTPEDVANVLDGIVNGSSENDSMRDVMILKEPFKYSSNVTVPVHVDSRKELDMAKSRVMKLRKISQVRKKIDTIMR